MAFSYVFLTCLKLKEKWDLDERRALANAKDEGEKLGLEKGKKEEIEKI